MFIVKLWETPLVGFSWLLIIVFSICFHELMHAVTAKWQGDSTAADLGHISMNPLKQMGLVSLFMLFFIGIAWGAVPVNRYNLRHKYSDALVSFAGPFANLLLCTLSILLASLAFVVIKDALVLKNLVQFFQLAALLNLVLFVLNMCPIPTFDGWHVLCNFFPRLEHAVNNSEFNKGATLVVMIILFKNISKIFAVSQIAVAHAIEYFAKLFMGG
ncbi:site-2 protease family protein [Lentisphaerota bacterium WC36G]|nr:site-2 protease family protein [Lentisphaerae bacterium WC36]